MLLTIFILISFSILYAVIPYYKVTFENENYPVAISNFIPKYSKVMTVKAIVEGTSKQIKYSLIKSYPKPFQVKKYPFRISPYKGMSRF